MNPRLEKYLQQKVIFRAAGTQDQHGDATFGTPTALVRCRISNPTIAHRRLVAQLESIDPSMVVYFAPQDWPAYGPKVGDHLQVPDANWQPIVRIDNFYRASGGIDHYRVIVGS